MLVALEAVALKWEEEEEGEEEGHLDKEEEGEGSTRGKAGGKTKNLETSFFSLLE